MRYNTSSDARGCVFHEVVKIKSDLNQPSYLRVESE